MALGRGARENQRRGTSIDSILLRAATGAGVAVLPDLFARKQAIHRDEIVVKPLIMHDAHQGTSLMFPIDQPVDNSRNHLVEAIRNAARPLSLVVHGS
jgi:LysR family transcriptional regulator, hydrogen peroxide-inducible genes activator